MIISTTTGTVRGLLVAFQSQVTEPSPDGLDGVVLIRRENPPMETRPYSTHQFYTSPDGTQYAESGVYDLSLEEARLSFAQRTGRL